jgi:hypothetical protein
MNNDNCDLIHPNGVKEKPLEVIDGYTIKYHSDGKPPFLQSRARRFDLWTPRVTLTVSHPLLRSL